MRAERSSATPDDWVVVEASDPSELFAAADLFDDEITPESAVDSLARAGHHILLAISHSNQAVGFVSCVEMRHPDKAPEMFVNELGVVEAWRRRGVARSLLTAVLDLARQRGVATLWTATEPDNAPALATYRAHGADTSETAVMVSIDVSLTD